MDNAPSISTSENHARLILTKELLKALISFSFIKITVCNLCFKRLINGNWAPNSSSVL